MNLTKRKKCYPDEYQRIGRTNRETTKFKVGDEVRIRKGLTGRYNGGCNCTQDMINMAGEYYTIIGAEKFKENDRFTLDKHNGWNWSEDMLELVTSKTNTINESNIKHEVIKKMEAPKTKLEKQALVEAKKDVITKKVANKKVAYESEMNTFIQNETDARYYRKLADEKAKVLGITKTDIEALF